MSLMVSLELDGRVPVSHGQAIRSDSSDSRATVHHVELRMPEPLRLALMVRVNFNRGFALHDRYKRYRS
jgi:hypothetical protein